MQAHGVRVFARRAGVQLQQLLPSGQNRFSTASSASPESESGAHHKQRERELILSVLSTVPSPREARKFLNSVSGNETMRSQREFEERQARLATEEPTVRTPGRLVPGEILRGERAAETRETEAVPRRLTASVFIDGLESPGACERTGKLLAQIQRIGVSPVVLLANNGSADATCGGYRSIIRQVHQLADAVEREGGKARPINEGVFFNNPYARTDLTVDPELIGAAIAQGQTPIISPLMADAELQVKVLKPRVAAAAVARALAQSTSTQHAMAGSGGAFSLLVARLILLGGADGLTGDGDVFHRFVNLEEDYAEVAAACAQPDVLELMRTSLAILPPTAAGIVASVDSDPSLVLKGLISERPVATQQRPRRNQGVARQSQAVRRAGIPSYRPLPNYPFVDIGGRDVAKAADVVEAPTQFTLLRHGFQIQRHTKLDTCNVPRLRSLLESSFKRTLDAGQYFERLRQLQSAGGVEIIVAGDYQGAVIVTHEAVAGAESLPYLDKFAVLPSAQGTGMADILWAQLRRTCPSCMWRSRNDNGVNKWYFDRSSGHVRAPAQPGATQWVFFWYQSSVAGQRTLTVDEIQAGIAVSQKIAPSFI